MINKEVYGKTDVYAQVLTKEILEEEYIKNNLTDKQIAQKYNVGSKVTVWRRRKYLGIENRLKNKSNKNACVNRRFDPDMDALKKMKDEGMTYMQMAEKLGCSRMVIARRLKEAELVKSQEQSIDNIAWDIELTEYQKSMLIGSLLGDGNITNERFQYTHSRKQKEYAQLKLDILSNILGEKPIRDTKVPILYKGELIEYDAVYCQTLSNKYLSYLYDVFYKNNKKIFPYDFLINRLDACGLAFWFMDDGSNHQDICTQSFTLEEHDLMRKLFDEKFGIKINRHADGKLYSTYIPVESWDRFVSLIRPHVIPLFDYKLNKTSPNH